MIFFIISEPVETFVFKNNVNRHLKEYKEILVDNFKNKLETISNKEIEKLIYDNQSTIEFNLRNNIEIDSLNQQILDDKITSIIEKNDSEVNQLKTKLICLIFSFNKL